MPSRITKPGAAGVLLVIVAVAAAALVITRSPGVDSTTPAEPAAEFDRAAANVVVVMTDDQSVDTMRAMPRTRRLIGGHGVKFDNAVVSFPLCCPSRATFQTGQYAHNHGVLDNSGPRGGYKRLDTKRTLPVWLSRAGYETGFVGKYLNGYGKGEAGVEVPPGWSEWYGLPAKAKQRPFGFELNENGKLVQYEEDDYKTDVLAGRAASFLKDHAGERPFFLWVAPDAPHKDAGVGRGARRNPEPAPRDRGRFENRRAPNGAAFDEKDVSDKPGFVRGQPRLNGKQRAEIRKVFVSQLESLVAVDRLVKGIVKQLRRTGELDNTLIVFTSDHGFLRGQHRIESGKSAVYEEAIRVPLLVRGPGFPAGVRDHRLVGNIDLAPTILELAGAKANVEVDGRSLLPFDGGGGRERDRTILLEVYERKTGRFVGVRTGRYAYAEYDKGDRELYDLERDPEQLENVADEPGYAEVRGQLSKHVAELRDCAGTECG